MCSTLTHVEHILNNQAAKLIIDCTELWTGELVATNAQVYYFYQWLEQDHLSLWTLREIKATFSITIQKTLKLSCQMDKDSGLCFRPADKWSKGEVVRACQGMAHQLKQ